MEKSKKFAISVLAGLPIMCALGGMLGFASASGRAKKSETAELAAARAAGMPLVPADIRQPTIAPDRNSAEIYRQAGDMLEHGFVTAQKAVTAGLAKNPTPKVLSQGEKALVDLKPIFDLVHGLDTRPSCNFDRDWSSGPSLLFPEYSGMKALVKDLVFKADRQDLKGDTQGALKSMSYAHRVATDAGSDPCLISMLVEIACREIIDREYEHLIDRHSSNAAYLEQVRTMIQEHVQLPNPRKYLGGEIVMNRIAIRMISGTRDLEAYEGDEPPPRSSPIQKSFFQSSLVQSTLDSKLLAAWRVGWNLFPQDPQNWQAYLAAMKQMSFSVDQDNSVSNLVNKILFPVFNQGMEAVGILQAHDRLLLSSIALLKIRQTAGKLPVTTPSSLGELRNDPFDGNPLRYRREGQGFMLYSIGRDRVDNGGHRREPGDTSGTGFDEVMEFK